MKQYLLSIYQPDGDPPPPEVLEPIMRDIDAVNAELKAAGAWVFTGGLHPPEVATVLRAADGAVQGAFAEAARRWPSAGLPPSPAGWIITTARNRAIDRLRREAAREDKHAQAALLRARDEDVELFREGPVRDDRLRLMFTC